MTFWTCFPVFCFFFFFTSLIRWPSLAFVSSLGTGLWPQKKMLFHLLVLECARTSNESNDSFSTIWHVRPTPWGQELMGLGLGVRLSRYPDIPRSFAKAPDGLQGAARLHYTWLEADYRIWNQLFGFPWIPNLYQSYLPDMCGTSATGWFWPPGTFLHVEETLRPAGQWWGEQVPRGGSCRGDEAGGKRNNGCNNGATMNIGY